MKQYTLSIYIVTRILTDSKRNEKIKATVIVKIRQRDVYFIWCWKGDSTFDISEIKTDRLQLTERKF
ncbi:hypothetical protein WN51_10304 [Melipona quadrifasciata]|uniref:Uncharacterized protein n=1 Tax=Melipona quadrifasciata TaxID=166423 RepID=A0A0N0BIB8_9HYME|nr:hypothetical protein WN51_10304 [Melipona quadrifasciata]